MDVVTATGFPTNCCLRDSTEIYTAYGFEPGFRLSYYMSNIRTTNHRKLELQ